MLQIMKKIVSKVQNVVKIALYILSCKVPRDKKLWVYGAWQGNLFADNSKYMFKFANSQNDGIKHIWISKKQTVVDEVRGAGYRAYKANNIRGMWYTFRAGVIYETEGHNDTIPFLIGGALIIQLWHGMGMKNVAKWSVHPICKEKYRYEKFIYAHIDDVWMVACQDAVEKYSQAYSIDKARMYITGQPKDDTFCSVSGSSMVDAIRARNSGCKIVVYLPTHRNFGREKATQNVTNIEELSVLNEKLKAVNTVMIFKPHFHEFKNFDGIVGGFTNIIFATDPKQYGDVYEFLPACDALITDYSGIMLGYLTANKPIIYFPYDFDEYMKNDAGFCYKYDDVTAGVICYTWDEVVDAIKNDFYDEKYCEKRKKLQNRFSPYCDGKNAERVYLKVKQLLQEER